MASARQWIVCLTLLVGGWAYAAEPPSGKAAELGFSSARLDYIDRFYMDKVNRGELAGVVTLIARHGKIAHFSAVGYADIEKKQKMQRDTIFRLYSMTKPIASTALMMLYEEGRFQMQDPLSKYIPEFADLRVLRKPGAALDDTVPLVRPPTVQDVMRHTGKDSLAGTAGQKVHIQRRSGYSGAARGGVVRHVFCGVSRAARIPSIGNEGRRFLGASGQR